MESLAAKIAEARLKIQQLRDRVAPYANVPQYIYWKNVGEEIVMYSTTDSVGGAKPYLDRHKHHQLLQLVLHQHPVLLQPNG
jgi:hypothetical protein